MPKFPCPKCGVAIKAPDDKAGEAALCPGCKKPIVVPGKPREINYRDLPPVRNPHAPPAEEPDPFADWVQEEQAAREPVQPPAPVYEPLPVHQPQTIYISTAGPERSPFKTAFSWGCGVWLGLTAAGLSVTLASWLFCCGGLAGLGIVGNALSTERKPPPTTARRLP